MKILDYDETKHVVIGLTNSVILGNRSWGRLMSYDDVIQFHCATGAVKVIVLTDYIK